MAQPVYNVRDAWAVFNGLYHKAVLIPNHARRTERKQQELRKQIQRDWARIGTDHPDNHMKLKTELRDAIRRTTVANRLIDQARGTIAIESARNRFYNGPADIHEDLVLAQMRLLDALKHLVEVGEQIGRAAGSINTHAHREIARLKKDITNTAEHVGFLRHAEEGHGNEDRRNARRIRHRKSWRTPPPPGGWLWYDNIANTPLACVSVCVAGDEHNRIVNRVVLKDVWFIDTPGLWTSPDEWIGDPEDPLVKIPTWVHIMGRLALMRQRKVVRMRGWHLAPEKLMYRIFLEYCPYGDGADMMHHHLMLNSRNRQQNSYVPEPAIWCMFDSLMKAGLAMEQELEAEPQQLFETRELGEVIHLDIKPGNVFFGDYPEDDSINFAMYPTCKLGDFGGAIYRRLALQSQPTDPNRFLDRGTPGFFAPEQKSRYYGQHRPALNPKTNVWAVGITVMAFMNLDFSTGLLAFTEAANKNKSDPRLVPSFTPEAMARYSSVLRDMVRACVQYEQKKRPGFRALLDASRNHTGLAPRFRDLAHGARFGTRHSIPAGLTLLSGLPTDKYALGMAMPA